MAGRKTDRKLTSHRLKHLGSFRRTAFAAKHETTSANVGPGSLSNEIHALFDKDHLKTCFNNHDVVEQSARLASHLLRSQPLQGLFHALITGHGTIRRPDKQKQYKYYVYREADLKTDQPLSQKEQDQVDTAFKFLAGALTYQIDETGADSPTTVQTDPVPDYQGYRSIIKIPSAMIKALENAHKGPDVPKLLILRFELAVALVHEVSHALRNLYSGKLDREPFIGHESALGEVGFEMEKRMFGGIITRLYTIKSETKSNDYSIMYHDGKKSDLLGLLVLLHYPSRLHREKYRGLPCMGVRNERAWVKNYDVAWRVHLEFVAQLLTAAFWSRSPADVAKGLRPNREIGYTFHYDPTQEILVPVEEADDEKKYVLDGYERNMNGEIVRQSQPTNDTSVAGTSTFAQPDVENNDSDATMADGAYPSPDSSYCGDVYADENHDDHSSPPEKTVADVAMTDATMAVQVQPLKRRRDPDDDGAAGGQAPAKKQIRLTIRGPRGPRPPTP